MNEKILVVFVKEMHVGGKYKLSLVKEEIAFGPPIPGSEVLLSNDQKFPVVRILQDLRQYRYIVFCRVEIPYYERHTFQKVVDEQLEKGWEQRA